MKHSYAGISALAAFAAVTLACGTQEGQVIDNFFRATQAKDTQTVSSFSTVQFDQPVKSWKVKSIGEEQRSPAPLATLAAAHTAADSAAAENKKAEADYFNAHPLEVDSVKPLVESGAAIPPKLQATAADWKKFVDTDKELTAKAEEAQKAYEREKRIFGMSTGKSGADADTAVGDLITKTAVVEVESDGGAKTYAVQLRKYDVTSGGKGAKLMSRWLIQSITPQ